MITITIFDESIVQKYHSDIFRIDWKQLAKPNGLCELHYGFYMNFLNFVGGR